MIRLLLRAAPAILLALLAACATPPPAPEVGKAGFDVPASYGGTLPCADCPDIAATLSLFGDGHYRLRQQLVGAPEGEDVVRGAGRWLRTGPDGNTLLLLGEDGRLQRLTLTPDGGLRPAHRDDHDLPLPDRLSRLDGMPLTGSWPMVGVLDKVGEAAFMTDCVTGERHPVAPEAAGDAVAAESSGARLRLHAHYAQRTLVEGEGSATFLVAEEILDVAPSLACPAADTASLTGTDWRVVDLAGEAVPAEAGLSLTLQADRASGTGGCNRFSGEVAIGDGTLEFGPIASTRRACAEGMERETRYLEALRSLDGYERWDGWLILSKPKGVVSLLRRAGPEAGTAGGSR